MLAPQGSPPWWVPCTSPLPSLLGSSGAGCVRGVWVRQGGTCHSPKRGAQLQLLINKQQREISSSVEQVGILLPTRQPNALCPPKVGSSPWPLGAPPAWALPPWRTRLGGHQPKPADRVGWAPAWVDIEGCPGSARVGMEGGARPCNPNSSWGWQWALRTVRTRAWSLGSARRRAVLPDGPEPSGTCISPVASKEQGWVP